MSLSVIYGSKNVTYDVAVSKISWSNPLVVIANGGIATPSSADLLYRDDLGGQAEAMDDSGVPLPVDTCIVYRINSVGINLSGEFHVHSIYDVNIVEDALNVILFVNSSGQISERNGKIYNLLRVANSEANAYADSVVRTDQEIIDVVTAAGVTINDYGMAMAERIQIIIDETMQNASITQVRSDLSASFDEMGLDGDTKAKIEADFVSELTKSVIQTAMNVGSQSMLTQKQGDLAVRQKEGFNDNLLVKANDSLSGALGLINSGTSNSVGEMVTRYDQTVNDLITRSKRT